MDIKNRVLTDDGHMAVMPTGKDKPEGLDRERRIYEQKLKSLEDNVKFRRSEIQSLKQQLKEQQPLLKQEVSKLQNEVFKLKEQLEKANNLAEGEAVVDVKKNSVSGFFGKKNKDVINDKDVSKTV